MVEDEAKVPQNSVTSSSLDTITIKKDQLWKYSTFGLAGILVILIIGFILPGGSVTGNAIAPSAPVGGQNAPTLPPAGAPLKIADGDHIMGDPNAPVKIFEFSDFECPFCGRFYSQTLSQIEDTYVKNGDVALVYKQFPLTSLHPQAQKAAEASECAAELGGNDAFWKMHNLLFESGVSGGESAFKTYASQIGLDAGEFEKCLGSGKYAAKISADTALGTSAGVRGTPGFIINGQLVSGAQPFSVFKQVIDANL